MTEKKYPNNRYQAEYRERMKAEGYRQKSMWFNDEMIEKLKAVKEKKELKNMDEALEYLILKK